MTSVSTRKNYQEENTYCRYTQRTKQTNLKLRSRLKRLVRRTIGFSKLEQITT
ncbi:hypothetical protein DA097_07200 [Vibrio rotiferianus]|nr:hypothetical protein DA097_07200 [Vibrio rotiferianus]